MERKVGLSILLISFTFIVCLVLNFPASLMGEPATIKNLIVTIVYIAVWILAMSIVLRNKNQVAVKIFLAFWLVNLFFAVLTVMVNLEILNAFWATPFIALLITQWYGIEIFADNFLITAIIISAISLLFIFAGLMSLIKNRRYKYGNM